MKKHKKRPRSLNTITRMLSIAMLLVWGISMALTTYVSAKYTHDYLYSESKHIADDPAVFRELNSLYGGASSGQQYTTQGLLDYRMLDVIRGTTPNSLPTLYIGYDILSSWKIPTQYARETVVLFYDKDGNILHKNGNYLYFSYYSEEAWTSGQQESPHYGWIDMGKGCEDDPYSRFRSMYAGTESLRGIDSLRITCTVEGSQIKPVTMHYRSSGYEDWQLQFDNSAELDGTEELVTIYTDPPRITIYEGSSIEYFGTTYESLLALAETIGPNRSSSIDYYPVENSLNRILSVHSYDYYNWTDYDPQTDPLPEMDFTMVIATVSYPLKTAVIQLILVYLFTFVLAAVGVLLLRRSIKKRLIRPLQEVNAAMAGDWWHLEESPGLWQEAQALQENYKREADQRLRSRNEIARLNTALDYARKAEQSRRQMTSHIAHELKTPLAVIHSYSEGLKAHIAEEKRDQYLDVILTETQRMDGMVLQMLDLSRLEAGKVKLARDTFSLSQLSQSILEKFTPMAQEKNLQISFSPEAQCTVAADEARIGQVITNLISNAIRYTPEGGTVRIRTFSEKSKACFRIENTGKSFTNLELVKVWEPFYQTDKSRHDKGTGLGLAITKNIIDLHSGECYVKNTPIGVEFGFMLSQCDQIPE